MKFSTIFSTVALVSSVFAAPVEQASDETIQVPTEAIISYLDLDGAQDIAVLPFSNSTASGLLFVNSTILEQANKEVSVSLQKRDADANADAWHWIQLAKGQPMYKRDAVADATADADAWHWIHLSRGQPMYKRDAIADADADADAWHWIQLAKGQPMY